MITQCGWRAAELIDAEKVDPAADDHGLWAHGDDMMRRERDSELSLSVSFG